MKQDGFNGFRLQVYSFLSLVVKRPIQATHVFPGMAPLVLLLEVEDRELGVGRPGETKVHLSWLPDHLGHSP
jgi:hypothetical protein